MCESKSGSVPTLFSAIVRAIVGLLVVFELLLVLDPLPPPELEVVELAALVVIVYGPVVLQFPDVSQLVTL